MNIIGWVVTAVVVFAVAASMGRYGYFWLCYFLRKWFPTWGGKI